jgi:hypothetical protein
MKPVLVFPFYDPQNLYFPHLRAALPDLEAHFARACISLPASSARLQPESARALLADGFFHCLRLESEAPMGTHFGVLYRFAAREADPGEILHLCFPDRLLFALRTGYRDAFVADVAALRLPELPLVFQRSARAWETHPRNYAELEGFVTRIGETLFGQSLDYGWCHFVIQAGELREVMREISLPNLDMVAQIVLRTQHHLHTREVDWLAWEDPFILGRDPAALKAERENSPQEYQKRLSYVLPMIENLVKWYK